ncbi:DNA cytosine methyltransferase [Bradyrhizobium sp. SZCCHNRI1002]|uniref:DNA cytosine methyltransferase n=1 Tax=Bradyrhizobium sp. SZCCHNRI1002 TaxID=3057274 RepID=UPI0028EAF462|nr:DNA cytosine methyltransferase [Bradyrhizobium sp. SZCCHNRI1002]
MARRKILVADLLCGAGGSSTGCARALAELGLEMDLVCVNHWGVAIETHKRNHPEARHYVEDIGTVRPHLLVPEGYLDLLMASPTCTHHSVARGGKPTSDQQRSDPWHIITWLTELRVRRLIIENVWEFKDWGPVDHRTGRPVKSRKGQYFMAWINAIRALGFDPEWRRLNAADYGDATTRQRFILMARSDRKRVFWPMPTHAKTSAAGNVTLFNDMKPWRAAREIIDWSIKGKSIFDRKRPLASATLARIHAGAVKFGWPEPFIVTLRNHMSAQGIDLPIPTIAANGTHIGIAEPVVVNLKGKSTARAAADPLATQTAHAGHLYVAEPFVMSRHAEGAPRSIDEPTPTQVAKQSHLLISPYYGSGSGETCTSGDAPLPTVTGNGRFGMVVPITHSDGSNRARDVADPLPTLTTANRGELAFISAAFGERDGQAPRVHDIAEPAPTICATGRVNLVEGTPQFDILFRMLEPHELAAAMGFNDGERNYEFSGTKTQKIKQIGNAVSVAKMKACVKAIMGDAAEKVARELIMQRAAE